MITQTIPGFEAWHITKNDRILGNGKKPTAQVRQLCVYLNMDPKVVAKGRKHCTFFAYFCMN